jgi:hypothetical protein
VISYRVILDVPLQLALYVADLLAAHRRDIGTRPGTHGADGSSGLAQDRYLARPSSISSVPSLRNCGASAPSKPSR